MACNPTAMDQEEETNGVDQNECELSSDTFKQFVKHDHIVILSTDDALSDNIISNIESSSHWKIDPKKGIRPWKFELKALNLCSQVPVKINLENLLPFMPQSIPYWLTFPVHTIRDKSPSPSPKLKKINFPSGSFKFSFQYGAITALDQFGYSPKHNWTSQAHRSCEISLQEKANGSASVQWSLKNSNNELMHHRLELLDIDTYVIFQIVPDGFDMYICQKCNLNMRISNTGTNHRRQSTHAHKHDGANASNNVNHDRRPDRRAGSQSRRVPPIYDSTSRQGRNIQQLTSTRIGASQGSYFPTVRFHLRCCSNTLLKNDVDNPSMKEIHSVLSLLSELCLLRRIKVCYGRFHVYPGPAPCFFLHADMCPFPTLLMKYAWHMLTSIGYRLQILIDQDFIDRFIQLSEEPPTPENLFYAVCVYLTRMLVLKPFGSINAVLNHAIEDSRKKFSASTFSLTSKTYSENNDYAYIPAVTLTPTTLKVRPLKLCRTNRVVRAISDGERMLFGTTFEHFVLVDIRDENGRQLLANDFQDLDRLLLDYLNNGFPLILPTRCYKYLHHSKSQIRERQFWFYHYNQSRVKEKRNLSFDEAYAWMGDFSGSTNPVKFAARMSLCFSTTRATINVRTSTLYYLFFFLCQYQCPTSIDKCRPSQTD
jgi:hypothetical protein